MAALRNTEHNTGAADDTIVLETADPRRVRRILGGVGAFLLVLVLLSSGHDGSSVALGVRPTEVLGATFDRSLPRDDTTGTTLQAAPVIITVPTLVPVDRPVPIVISAPAAPAAIAATASAGHGAVLRTANGPSAPEISRFFTATERPTARQQTQFRWWAGDADGLIRYVRVDFGDGHEDRWLLADRCVADPTDPSQERPPFAHTFEKPGTYTVTLTVASSGSCGNGPTQTVVATLEVQVGLVDVGTNVGA